MQEGLTMWKKYGFVVPEQKRLRYIVHTDCKNEADDQFTLCHALMTDKLDICGIIGGHFAQNGRQGTARESCEEIEKILSLMGLSGKYPVYEGADTGIQDMNTPVDTEAARFIIQEAMREDPRPLFIGMQGAITDLACAIMMEPRICERMTCIWIGGGNYPEGGWEFNLLGDIPGANVVFSSRMPLWQVPKGVYKQFCVSLAELQMNVRPCGKIGRYLFEQMVSLNERLAEHINWPHGETWCLGDEGVICALMQDPEQTDCYTLVPAPWIDPEMHYCPCADHRPIRVYSRMDVRLDLSDLFAKLKINFGEDRC